MSIGMGVMINVLFGDSRDSTSAIETAVGMTIRKAEMVGDGDGAIVLTFDGGTLTIKDEGRSCCESRYLTCDDNLDNLIGDALVSVEEREGPTSDDDEWGEVHETAFVVITTDKGAATVATHNEHNGYYGGFWMVAEWSPVDGEATP